MHSRWKAFLWVSNLNIFPPFVSSFPRGVSSIVRATSASEQEILSRTAAQRQISALGYSLWNVWQFYLKTVRRVAKAGELNLQKHHLLISYHISSSTSACTLVLPSSRGPAPGQAHSSCLWKRFFSAKLPAGYHSRFSPIQTQQSKPTGSKTLKCSFAEALALF